MESSAEHKRDAGVMAASFSLRQRSEWSARAKKFYRRYRLQDAPPSGYAALPLARRLEINSATRQMPIAVQKTG